MRGALPLLVAAILPAALRAQAVRVALADTATAEAPAHVFVALVPAAGGPAVDQGLTGAGGVRLLRAPAPGRFAVVVRRVGYAPERFGPYALAAGATVDARVALAGRRVRLERVTLAEAARCGAPAPGAEGGDALLAAWDALRAALETSAQGRDERAAAVETRTFRRELTLNGEAGRRREEPWTAAAAARPFTAVVSDNRFVVGNAGVDADWLGPDERTFLSEAFVRGHCFARVEGAGADSGMVGLRFEPVRGARAPDVAGVLWLDRERAELRRVEYRYVRLDWGRTRVPVAFERERLDEPRPVPGGVIEFTRLPTGAWIVSRWVLRVPRIRREGAGGLAAFGLTEVGAEARLAVAGGAAPLARAHGVAWDSLRARPLAGALVFGPGGRSAATDAAGRWAIDSLPAGAATFTVAHPGLDSLAVYDVGGEGEARAGGGDTVRLASPSLATLSRELCPPGPDAAAPAGPGVVYGTVRGARAGARVEVAWTVLPDARGVRAGDGPTTHGRAAPANADGAFAVCGLPADVALRVRAAADSADRREARAPWVDVWLDAALPLRHLTLSAPAAAPRAVLRGTVHDSLGRPIANALVRVSDPEAPGDSLAAPVRTGADGAFRVAGLPEGTALVEATAVGHVPARETVALRGDDATELALRLRRGTVLTAAVTREKFTEAFLADVERRRLQGAGTIRTAEQLERYPQVASSFTDIPGVRVRHTSGNRWSLLLTRGAPLGGCEPQIYLDAQLLNPERATGATDPGATDMLAVLAPADLAAVEVYQNGALAPQQYVTGVNRCGVVLVWTRAYARMPAR